MKWRSRSLKDIVAHGTRSPASIAGMVVVILTLLSSVVFFQGVAVGAALAPDILAPTIPGASIDPNSPGSESFWSQLTPLEVPLTATDDYGGAVQSVSLKIATNGTHILMMATYSDPSMSNSRVRGGPSANQTQYPGLFFANDTIHGFDQFAVWWAMSQNPGPPPCMQVATNMHGGDSPGSLTGNGNVWRWTGVSSDSNGTSFGTASYGAGTPLAGQPINYTHSYARNMLLNTSGFFTLGADSSNVNSTVLYAPDHTAYSDFIVFDKGVYDYTAQTWSQVIARPLTTTPSAGIRQFAPNTVYYFALGAWDGGAHPIPAGVPHPAGWTTMSDDGETKSISTWQTVEISPLAPGASAGSTTTVSTTVTQTATSTTSVVSTATTTSVTTATSTSVSTTVSTVTAAPSTVLSTVTQVGTGPTYQIAAAAMLLMMVVGLIIGMMVVGRFGLRGSPKT